MQRVTYLFLAFVLLASVVVQAAEQRMVRLGIMDQTEERRLPASAEVWFRGQGSVWLHKSCNKLSNGTLACGGPLDLGMRDVEQPLELFIYPEGRDGGEIKAVFKLTADMCKPGCDRDMLRVYIYDATVEVEGAPILAQHKKITLAFKRR